MNSKEAQKFLKDKEKAEQVTSGPGAVKRPGGLNSIMGLISGKKQKLGALDKSKMDWDKFVAEEGIRDDLKTHNRGKDG